MSKTTAAYLALIVGAALTVTGVWLVYMPAGLITAGIVSALWGLVGADVGDRT